VPMPGSGRICRARVVRAGSAFDTRLRLTVYDKLCAVAQPFKVRACGHASKCRVMKLACCGLCKCRSRLLRPLDAADARKNLMESKDFARQPAFTRPRQEAADPCTIGLIGVTESVSEHNSPFFFPQIAIDLLAIRADSADQVKNVVGDLEREPKQIAEPVKSTEILVLAVGDECPNSHGMNEAGGLLEHEPQIIVHPHCEIIVAHQPSSMACPSRVSTSR
jgi:hypothetical protein